MAKQVLLGYYEDADVAALIDEEVKKRPGMQRSDWLREATRIKLWGPAYSLAESIGNLEKTMDILLANHGLRVRIEPSQKESLEAPRS